MTWEAFVPKSSSMRLPISFFSGDIRAVTIASAAAMESSYMVVRCTYCSLPREVMQGISMAAATSAGFSP